MLKKIRKDGLEQINAKQYYAKIKQQVQLLLFKTNYLKLVTSVSIYCVDRDQLSKQCILLSNQRRIFLINKELTTVATRFFFIYRQQYDPT